MKSYVSIAILAFCAGISVSFFTLPLWVAFLINIAKEGTRTDWLGLFGNTIGAAVTLIAAAIAWIAVRQQIASQKQLELDRRTHEAEDDRRRKEAAKHLGVIALSQTVVMASKMRLAAKNALNATTTEDAARWEKALNQAAAQVEDGLSQFALQQIVTELNEIDREQFLMLLIHIGTIVSIHKRPPGVVDERQRLKATYDHLNALPKYLGRIDRHLLNLFND